MADWMLWLIFAGIVVIFELFTGTFYLLMIAIGLASGGISAWLGSSDATQLVVAGIVGAFTTYGLRRSRFGRRQGIDPARDPNVNLDIGQTLAIDQWHANMARVMYRGAMWDVELAAGEDAKPGNFIIREVRGNRLIVSHHHS
jgi:membrane protein implicated in regulation of membrane protease activity